MAAVCLGGVTGGVGKTTLTLALAAALRVQGRSVRSYCIGPGLPAQGACGPTAAAAGSGSPEQLLEQPVSLDGWLLTQDSARAVLHSLSAGADISIIEGCLGMFDSPTPDSGSEQGSTAQVVGWLRVPLVLVIDAAAFSSPRALVALISGYAGVDGSVPVAGVILNKAPSKALAAELQDALRQAGLGQVAVLGAVPKIEAASSSAGDCSGRQQLAYPWSPLSPSAASSVCGASCCTSSQQQQHQQQPFSLQQLAEMAAQHIDLDRLQALAAGAAVPPPSAPLPPPARTYRVSVGVAHDEAFRGYFTQNLHMLQCAGVQLVRFSPLHDCQLPPGLSAVLLGAGDVPACAGGLSGNAAMLAALRAFAAAGGLVVGEADGLMYLSRSLQQAGGQRHRMLGLLPFHTQALSGSAARQPSYVTVEVAQAAHPLLLPGSRMRGVASCCCQVVEERLLGGLSAALAAAAAAPADADAASAAAGGPEAADPAPAAAAGGAAAKAAAVSCSYSVVPRGGAAAVAEGYTCGSVLGSCVMVHYGSCPEVVAHLAQRCLRVDVASATAAASAAASQAAAAAAEAATAAAAADAAAAAEQLGLAQPPLPPGNRALSAPDLQLLMWQYQQYGCSADTGSAAAGPQDAWSAVGSPVVGGGMPAAAAFLAGKKSASIPLNMYQMGFTPEQLQQQQQSHGLSLRVGSMPGTHQQQQGGGPPWNPLPFHVPKRWSLELQRLGSLTSQLLPGGGKGPQQQQQHQHQPQAQTQQPGQGSRGGGQAHHHSQHSHSGSFPGMVHLPEEAPLSDATIQLLDSTMPSLLGRTHHTRLGVAVPLSSGGGAASAAAAGAAAAGGGTATASGQLPVAAGGCKPESSAGGGMSKISSIHEQMSCLAASLAQQEGLGPAASAAASQCDEWQQDAAHSMLAAEPQQPQLQHHWPQGSRLLLDQHTAYQPQLPQQAALAAARSRLSFESVATPGGVKQLLPGGSEQQSGLCAELSFKAMVTAAQHGSSDHLPGAANGMSKSSSSHKLNGWQAVPSSAGSSAAGAGTGAGGRIISLSPAATDCLIALGLSSRLAGVTDACRPVSPGSGGCSSPLAQLLSSIGADWAADVAQQASGAGAAPGQQAAELPVVCRLVEGSDGLPRYKLDEDHIRRVQPSLVVVACDENSDDERHEPHFKQLQADGWAKGGSGAGSAAAGPGGGSGGGGSAAGSRAWGFGPACQATMNSGVAVPGRVRLEVAVVQRVLQRAGVLWPEARAVVLYQRCHSLAEVLEFVLVLAAAAGVPDRGVVLVQGLRARLRAAAGRLFVNSGLLARGLSSGSASSRSSGSSSEAALALAPPQGRRPVVMVLESVVPLRLAGFWVPEMLDLAQAAQAAANPAACEPPRGVLWPELRAAAPDVLLLALSGLDAARGALHTAQLACLPGFWSLPAVRAGSMYVCDHTLLMRPGPGLVLGCELLAHLVSPDRVPLPQGLPPGSVFKLSLHGGQRCRPRLVPNYLSRYC